MAKGRRQKAEGRRLQGKRLTGKGFAAFGVVLIVLATAVGARARSR
ncbi:MAG: hypothetical protein F6J86_26855 [Symploca sp. SIO1B1]|nr:hypothetical protein [Symploca sp. SIO1C2]NER46269.1 hypothetical protein [Symploca sp. SIO1A3]NER97424.1 hypothetical protein [Symploca sp. SIO1B1]